MALVAMSRPHCLCKTQNVFPGWLEILILSHPGEPGYGPNCYGSRTCLAVCMLYKTTNGDPRCANRARKDSFTECIGWHPASRVANTFGHITTLQQLSFGLPATKLCRLGLRHGDPNTGAFPVVGRITPMVMCWPHPSRPINRQSNSQQKRSRTSFAGRPLYS